jgi:hypothetical protein
MDDPPRRRHALTHVGGPIETEGDPGDARLLAAALDVASATGADDDAVRRHVHGFHTYPARMHPDTAAHLVRAFVPPGGRVLDPFCGSGTVLVEALAQGRTPLGTDLNPLAVMLSRCKTRPRTEAEVTRLVELAKEVAADADARRKARAGATRRLPPEDVALFEPHVLLELDSLRVGIDRVRDDHLRADLALVLSSILVKLSRRRADTSRATAVRKTAAGFPARHFVQKAEDFAVRLGAFARVLPSPPPAVPFVAVDHAAELRSLPPGPVAAVVTSPPYAATYDYVEHHELRLRWLGLDPTPLARGEMGGRRRYRRLGPPEARREWERELAGFLYAIGRRLPAGGPAVLLLADSAVGSVALRADEVVAEVARGCGFVPAARASQARPHFHLPTAAAFRDRPRFEHGLLLRRS